MPYYAGDYYTGDYYQGDNYGAYQAGGIFKTLGRIAGRVLGATPIGGLVRGGIAAYQGLRAMDRPDREARTYSSVGSAAGYSQPAALIPGFPGPGRMPGGRRRMNPLNIKALRRAMRRAKGFERQARRVGSFFNPGKTYRLKGRAKRPK